MKQRASRIVEIDVIVFELRSVKRLGHAVIDLFPIVILYGITAPSARPPEPPEYPISCVHTL